MKLTLRNGIDTLSKRKWVNLPWIDCGKFTIATNLVMDLIKLSKLKVTYRYLDNEDYTPTIYCKKEDYKSVTNIIRKVATLELI